MRRGTTPGYVLTINEIDLSECRVFVTIQQYSRVITLSGSRLDIQYDPKTNTSSIAFSLTQTETLTLGHGTAEIQVRYIDVENYADATDIANILVLPILNEDVIVYDNTGN